MIKVYLSPQAELTIYRNREPVFRFNETETAELLLSLDEAKSAWNQRHKTNTSRSFNFANQKRQFRPRPLPSNYTGD